MKNPVDKLPDSGRRRDTLAAGRNRCCAILGALLGLSTLCYGSAFSINELGARAAGMGTAFIGMADDGSAIFYNPAGIAFQPGAHMQMDSTVVVGLFRFTPSSTPVGQVVPANGYSESIRPHIIPVAGLYTTMQMSPKMTVGFGIFTPFGLAANSTNFNDSDPNLTKFVSRFDGTRVQLQSYWFQPTLAYRVTENLAVALGPAFVHTHLELEQSILNPLGPDDGLKFGRVAAPTVFPGVPVNQAAAVIARLLPEGRSRIAGTANAPGFAAGILWRGPGKTNVGLMMRSAVVSHLSGKASFAFGNQPYALETYIGSSFLPNAFPNQAVKGSFTTPATYGIGISNSKFRYTTLSFDVRFQDYRRFSSVPLNFSINEDTPGTQNIALPAEKRLKFDFRNSWDIAVGVERILNAKTTVRLGYLFDGSPVPEQSAGPLFPDSTRHSFTVGASRKSGNKEFTLFYEAMKFVNRTTNVAANDYQWTNGDYHNFANLAGLALRFDISDLVARKKH
jgi:long-chain fatty acid transport protein